MTNRLPASGRGIGLSVEMSITEALGLIEALQAEVAAARRRSDQAGAELGRISGG